MSYRDFYDLNDSPFSNTPGERYYYDSEAHNRVFRKLHYAIEEMKGLAVCTGGVGAGKTMLARKMLRSLPQDKYETALLVIVHSGITPDWLLRRIALQLGIRQPATSELTLLSQLYRRLIQLYENGKKAVVMIDEAQMLKGREIMEELRGLLNLEVPGHKLITFVLFGLPELYDNLKIDEPLLQRMGVRCDMDSMNSESTAEYIAHRLSCVDGNPKIFESDAVAMIHKISSGIPRLVNTLCDNALFEASLLKRHHIGAAIIMQVAEELGLMSASAESDTRNDLSDSLEYKDPEELGDDVVRVELEEFDQLLNKMDKY